MSNYYESLAQHYANEAVHLRAVATVHLENMYDSFFWEPILKCVKPGLYNFIGFSKSMNGDNTSGCTQCLKFKGFLNKNFFICMDSDYRIFGLGNPVSADEYFVQTYTYSWENHLCFANDLQGRLTRILEEISQSIAFDFRIFLSKLSEAVHPIVLQYLSMRRNGRKDFTKGMFTALFDFHLDESDYANNGDGIVHKLTECFTQLQSNLQPVYTMDLEQETAYYGEMGLSKENAYLRMRGHALYPFINKIGSHFCKAYRLSFEKKVLSVFENHFSHYPEMDSLMQDVRQILL